MTPAAKAGSDADELPRASLAGRVFALLARASLTRAEIAARTGADLRDVDAALSRLAKPRYVWPENRGGTVVWELTAAGRVAAERSGGS